MFLYHRNNVKILYIWMGILAILLSYQHIKEVQAVVLVGLLVGQLHSTLQYIAVTFLSGQTSYAENTFFLV